MAQKHFLLVLLQRVDAQSLYTRPLMSALTNAGALFEKALGDGHIAFEVIYLAPSLPTDDLRKQPRIDWAKTEQLLKDDDWWGGPRARNQQVEQELIVRNVRALIKAKHSEYVIVAVNASITPPRGWSYALWDGADERSTLDKRSTVIGISPMSPQYWGDKSGDRMERVKTISARLRATACAVIGRHYGLATCVNPTCFLFDPIDSVTQLDEMRELGAEHEASFEIGDITDVEGTTLELESSKEELL